MPWAGPGAAPRSRAARPPAGQRQARNRPAHSAGWPRRCAPGPPIGPWPAAGSCGPRSRPRTGSRAGHRAARRSEEHTSELQSRLHLVCRLLLEKKKSIDNSDTYRFSTYLQSTFYYNGPPHNTHDTTMQEVEEIYETVALTLST